MKLTKFTDYSFRVLIFLALNSHRKSTIEELNRVYSISPDHLRKIIHHLSKQGLIETTRGQKGGVTLTVKTLSMALGNLLKILEPDIELVECLGPKNTCILDGACLLKKALKEAENAFIDQLNRYDLNSLVQKKKAVMRKFEAHGENLFSHMEM